MKTLISFVGEQPIPNLLVSRHLEAERVILFWTNRTEKVAERLKKQLATDGAHVEGEPNTDAFAADVISGRIRELCAEGFGDGPLKSEDLFVDLTGGTKMMSLGAFNAAQSLGTQCVYCETNRAGSRLYRLGFGPEGELTRSDAETIEKDFTLKEYLELYVQGGYSLHRFQNAMEESVAQVIRSADFLDEAMFNMRPTENKAAEIDFIVRRGQRIGIGEVKAKAKMDAAEHVMSLGEQRQLGTFVEKFIVSGDRIHENNLAVCRRFHINPIELDECYEDTAELTPSNREKLLTGIAAAMGVPR